jgi:hypothetical protein
MILLSIFMLILTCEYSLVFNRIHFFYKIDYVIYFIFICNMFYQLGRIRISTSSCVSSWFLFSIMVISTVLLRYEG